MKILVLVFILINISLAGLLHLPESRLYIPKLDIGYKQYNSPSLYKSSNYVLTFDDGPHPINTPKILDILKSYKVKATFFVLTEKLTHRNLPLIKRILDEGHIISSHDHSHDNNNKVDRKTFKKKLKTSFLKLKDFYKKANHKMTTFYFRFPYAQYGQNPKYHHMNVIKEVSKELFGKNCIHFVFWDIDSGDWIPSLSDNQVFKNIKAHHTGGEYTSYTVGRNSQGARRILKKKAFVESPTEGGVILQHDIQTRTIKGTELFLKYASQNHISIIPLTDVEEFSYEKLNCSFIN